MSNLHFFLLTLFFLVCVGGLLRYSRDRLGIIEYPFLLACVMLAWTLPQLVSLAINGLAPYEAVTKLTIFTILCTLASWLGYGYGKTTSNVAQPAVFSFNHLKVLAVLLFCVGLVFSILVRLSFKDAFDRFGGAWTGVVTVYVWLSYFLTAALALSLALAAKRLTPALVLVITLSSLVLIDAILLRGRREQAVELFLMITLFFWYKYRYVPPRTVMLSIVAAGAVLVSSVGEYREIVIGDRLESSTRSVASPPITEVAFVENYREVWTGKQPGYELFNAALTLEASERRFAADFGLSLWNAFVRQYVPAQFVGEDFKQTLRLNFEAVDVAEFGKNTPTGTTYTGMADAFRSFWYLGALKFWFIGLIMGRVFAAASAGSLIARVLLLLLTTDSLMAVTHSTHHFFLEFINFIVFVGALMLVFRFTNLRTSTQAPGARLDLAIKHK